MLERAPQPAGLHPHDRIGLRIEIGVASERIGGDGIGLDMSAVAREFGVDDEAEEVGKLRRFAEAGACDDTIQRGANVRVLGLARDIASCKFVSLSISAVNLSLESTMLIRHFDSPAEN